MEAYIGKLTTLCYLERDGKLLMLHRVKKKNDVNQDKWIGVGGHALAYESPEDCLLREVREETGLILTEYRFRGIVTFALKCVETQYMCLYTATDWKGELDYNCPEGVLEWVEKDRLYDLELWEGDKIFFRLLDEEIAGVDEQMNRLWNEEKWRVAGIYASVCSLARLFELRRCAAVRGDHFFYCVWVAEPDVEHFTAACAGVKGLNVAPDITLSMHKWKRENPQT